MTNFNADKVQDISNTVIMVNSSSVESASKAFVADYVRSLLSSVVSRPTKGMVFPRAMVRG
jgi:hypothetical protein